MSSWASNKEDKMLFENWRSYLLNEITPEQDAEARRAAEAEVDEIAPDPGSAPPQQPQTNNQSQQKIPMGKLLEAFVDEEMMTKPQVRALFKLLGRAVNIARTSLQKKSNVDLSQIDCHPKLGPIKYDYRDKIRDELQKMFDDGNWLIKIEYTKPPCNASQSQEPQGSDEQPEETPGDDQPADDNAAANIPIPVNKKLTDEERQIAGLNKSAAGSLASQLAKLFPDVDKSIITQILKDIAGQMKTNGLNIQEGKQLVLKRLVEEYIVQAILAEATAEEKADNQPESVGKLINWNGNWAEKIKDVWELVQLGAKNNNDKSDIIDALKQLEIPEAENVATRKAGKEKGKKIRDTKRYTQNEGKKQPFQEGKNLIDKVEVWIEKQEWDEAATALLKHLEQGKIAGSLGSISAELANLEIQGKKKGDSYVLGTGFERIKIALSRLWKIIEAALKFEKAYNDWENEDDEVEVEEEPTPAPEEKPKEKLRFDVVPDLFVQMWNRVTGPDNKKAGGISAKDAWERLPSGKEGRKVQTIREEDGKISKYKPRYAGMGTSTGKSREQGDDRSTEKFGRQRKRSAFGTSTEDVELTKVGWFKTQQDAPNLTSDKDLMTHNFDPMGTSEKDIRGGLRAFVGALMNKMKQYAKDGAGETTRRQGKSGTLNAKAVVGTRLKQGGIDLKKPEGAALQKKMQKVIRRFINKNLKRVGKTDIKVIAENAELRQQLVEVYIAHVKNQKGDK